MSAVAVAETERLCTHCGTPIEVTGALALAETVFCCHGCEMAYEIVQHAGLGDWYETREAAPERPGDVEPAGFEQLPQAVDEDGVARCQLRIDGLRCASCVWLTETILERSPGVSHVQVSYTDGRAELRWDPEVTDLTRLLSPIQQLGYHPRALTSPEKADRGLLTRLGVASFAAGNSMLLAVGIYLGWFQGMDPRFQKLFQWVSLILATPVALWSADPFYKAAWAALRQRKLHVDLPISLGVVALYTHGLISTFVGHDGYLDSMCALVALLLGGRVLEQGGRKRAAAAARALASQAPRVARRVVTGPEGETLETVDPAELERGALVEVARGEELPVDGIVRGGAGSVQMALLTGESDPVPVAPGERVVAGGLLLDGHLRVEVLEAGEGTLLSRMARQMEQGLSEDRTARSAADAVAPWFTAAVIVLSGLALALWWPQAGFDRAIQVMVAVLVVACPCALALADPLSTAVGLGSAARRGLLLRGGNALRRLAEVDELVLDKTGTLTGGEPTVVAAENPVLRIAAGIERASSHPLARAIVRASIERSLPLPLGEDIDETIGQGIEGTVDGRRYRVCGLAPGELGVWEIAQPTGPRPVSAEAGSADRLLGRIVLADSLRQDAQGTVAALHRAGYRVSLLTGDRREVAERMATAAGLDEVVAEVDPEQKKAWIEQRQRETGRKLLFVGDGLNDGPALTAAHVGLAMGSGSAASVMAADGVVAAGAIGPLLAGLRAARESRRAARAGVRRSLIYNVGAVTAALAGMVNPLVAAVLMPLSSTMVLLTALAVERRVAGGLLRASRHEETSS